MTEELKPGDPLRGQVIANCQDAEGFSGVVYDDATGRVLLPGMTLVGRATIGWGTNLHEALPVWVLQGALASRIDGARVELDRELGWWNGLDSVRRLALWEMAYALGVPKLRGFRRMLEGLQAGNWAVASAEALDSLWADETDGKLDGQDGARAKRLAKMLETGEEPEPQNGA